MLIEIVHSLLALMILSAENKRKTKVLLSILCFDTFD